MSSRSTRGRARSAPGAAAELPATRRAPAPPGSRAISAAPGRGAERREQQPEQRRPPRSCAASPEPVPAPARQPAHRHAPDPPARHLVHRELDSRRAARARPRGAPGRTRPAPARRRCSRPRARTGARAQPSSSVEADAALHRARCSRRATAPARPRRCRTRRWISPTICSRMSSSVTMPGGAAELVHHHGEVARPALEVAQLAVERLALRARTPPGGSGPSSAPRSVRRRGAASMSLA